MDASKTEPIALTETRSIDAYKNDADNIEEVVIARLTEEDIFKLSQEAFSWKSMAALRIVGIMFVQGCNQAGYGVDRGYLRNCTQMLINKSFGQSPNTWPNDYPDTTM
jgi:hypothetical protein